MMGNSKGASYFAVQGLMVIGAALFSSAKWTALANTAETMPSIYAARFVGIATFIVVAFLSRQHPLSRKHLFCIAVPFMMLYLAITTFAPWLHDGGALGDAVVYAVSLLYGVACSLFTLFFLTAFASFGPARCAVLFVLLELAANCFAILLDSFDGALLLMARNTALLASVAIFFVASKWIVLGGQDADGTCFCADEKCFFFPSGVLEWCILLIAAGVFHGLFGVIAQVSSPVGNSFALYDPGSTAMVIALETLLLVFLCFKGDSFGLAEVLVFVTVLYATGFALYSYAWSAGSLIAGALIRSGFSFSSVLMRTLVARKAYYNPSRSFLYFGAYCAAASVYPGRILGSLLSLGGGSQTALCESVSLAALWAICIFSILVFFLACGGGSEGSSAQSPFGTSLSLLFGKSRAKENADSKEDEEGKSSSPAICDSERNDLSESDFALRAAAFSKRLQLSQREEEVLLGILHGYSRVRIAEKLYLSPGTVKSYVGRIYSKGNVRSKQELISLVEKESLSEDFLR